MDKGPYFPELRPVHRKMGTNTSMNGMIESFQFTHSLWGSFGTIHFSSSLLDRGTGREAELELEFFGLLNDQMAGCLPSRAHQVGSGGRGVGRSAFLKDVSLRRLGIVRG